MQHLPKKAVQRPGLKMQADLILLAHFLFALFAVVGFGMVLTEPAVAWLHIPVVLWSALVNLAHWTCPLTPLERNLRRRAGMDSFSGGWIEHYLDPLVRPLGMPRRMELIAGVSVLLWNGILYGLLWLLA